MSKISALDVSAGDCCLPLMFLPPTSAEVSQELTRETRHSLIQAYVHCRLDYCNSALAGVATVYI